MHELGAHDAIMLAVPAATAVARPAVETPTDAGWLLLQVKVSPVTVAPSESVTVAVSCCVLPAAVKVVIGAGVMLRLATGHSVKVAGTPLTVFTVLAATVTCTMPGSLAVAVFVVAVLPEVKKLLSEATVELLMFQVKAPTAAVMSVAPLKACAV